MGGAEEKTVKEVKSPINFKFLAVLVGLVAVYHVANQLVENTDEFDFFEGSLTAAFLATTISAFLTARRYWGSEVFGKAYLALALGFACLFIGDALYNYYESVLGISPYPSIADVFFFALYPFTLYHLIKNVRYFKRTWSIPTKIFIVAFPVFIVGLYSMIIISDLGLEAILNDEDGAGLDFAYTLIFVAGASSTTTFAVIGIFVFRHSALAAAWSLLAAGIFLNDIADLWYYYTEIFGLWTRSHPTVAMWIMSNLMIIYSLYKHRRIL